MPSLSARPPIVRIANATFYRHHPSAVPISSAGAGAADGNPPLFSGLDFELPSGAADGAGPGQNWCIVGPSQSGKTTLLQILRGQHICVPPRARAYPYLATAAVPARLKSVARAIRYVGFDAEGTGAGLGPATSAYLSARYESRREATDFSLRDYLLGQTELNPYGGREGVEQGEECLSETLFRRVVADLRLEGLLALPVAFLSNGQGRRARIGRALLTRPAVLLLDEPFMGLDPPTVAGLSPLLRAMAAQAAPRLVLSARPQDPLPSWISHLAYLRTDGQVAALGRRAAVLDGLRTYVRDVRRGARAEELHLPVAALGEMGRLLTDRGVEGTAFDETASRPVAVPAVVPAAAPKTLGEPVVEMQGCRVQYGGRVVLGSWDTPRDDGTTTPGLVWTVRRGERWGVFGPNGSGKTTIVSLLCSDHPQTYALPIRLFGQSRLPGQSQAGQRPLTFWDIQARIGHSSPEVHQHMPRGLTARQVVESAWADTFRAKPRLTADARARVAACLRHFAPELRPDRKDSDTDKGDSLDWADAHVFGELSFSAQRVLLLARAVVKSPDIVVLDEALSGMDERVRDKCAAFLEQGLPGGAVPGLSPQQALVCIAHVREEVPDCVREWLCLPEANTGRAARFGRLSGPLRSDRRHWEEIWNVNNVD